MTATLSPGDTAVAPLPVAMPDLLARLEGIGVEIASGSNRPFWLDEDSVWIIRQGSVDIFAVVVDQAGAPGARAHLFRVDSGGWLVGFGAEPAADTTRRLLAVGTAGTLLLRVPHDAVRALAATPSGAAAVETLLDGWVESLYAGIARDVPPARTTELTAGVNISVLAEASVRPQTGVVWLRHAEGSSSLFGKPELRVNGHSLLPLSRRAWLEAREPSHILVLDASAAAESDARWEGLRQLNVIVLRYADILATQATTANRERLKRKTVAQQTVLERACDKLAATMQQGSRLDPRQRLHGAGVERPGDESPDSIAVLFAACRVVADASGIVLTPLPASQSAAKPRDPLDAILRASRVRARKVALRDSWWLHDQGPLLGGIGADARPVALLRSRRGYTLHDPVARSDQEVTPALAETLSPFAYAFYRPFPDIALGVGDIARFGLRNASTDILMLLVMGLAGALLSMIPSMAIGVLFSTVIPGAQRSQLLQLTLVLIACAVTAAMFNVARGISLLRVEGRMAATVQAAVWDRLLSLPLSFFRPYTAGDLAVRAMSIDAMRQVISGSTVTAILGGVFSIGNFGLMFYYSPSMAWRATGLMAIAIAVTVTGSMLQLRPQRGVMALQAKTSGLVLQLLSSVAKLRVAGAEPQAFALWATRFGEQRRLEYKVRRVANFVSAFNAAFPVMAAMLIFWTAHSLIATEGSLGTGQFLAFLSAFTSCSSALIATSIAMLATLNTVPLYEQAKPILRTLPEVDGARAEPGVLTGDIEVQNVVFRYHTQGPLVLRELTLHAAPGEFVALVGPSGSGKSTILRLLLGFETLESGAINYDGQELAGLDVQALRRQIGVVLQSGSLTTGDIFTNIVGSAPLGMDEAWEAARMAGLADDIEAMPMGMHTVVSSGGGTLSGGQKQRLMIARALVHRPRILLFDEATSALDNHTQAIVSASLSRLQATRIVVAHRLSTVLDADNIHVVDRGRIVERGNFDELMRRDGLFAQLARRQLA